MKYWDYKKERTKAIVMGFIIVAVVCLDNYLTQSYNCRPEYVQGFWKMLNYFIPFWGLSTLLIYYIKKFLYEFTN